MSDHDTFIFRMLLSNVLLFMLFLQGLPAGDLAVCWESKTTTNLPKNRYVNILPCKYIVCFINTIMQPCKSEILSYYIYKIAKA